jgi:hypothetical protein
MTKKPSGDSGHFCGVLLTQPQVCALYHTTTWLPAGHGSITRTTDTRWVEAEGALTALTTKPLAIPSAKTRKNSANNNHGVSGNRTLCGFRLVCIDPPRSGPNWHESFSL